MGAPVTPSTRTDTPAAPAAPQDTVRLTPYALLCIGLLIALGFSLGCSEFIVIGTNPRSRVISAFHFPRRACS